MAVALLAASADRHGGDPEGQGDVGVGRARSGERDLPSDGLIAGLGYPADLGVRGLIAYRAVSDLLYGHLDEPVGGLPVLITEMRIGREQLAVSLPACVLLVYGGPHEALELEIEVVELLLAVGAHIHEHGALHGDGVDGGTSVDDADGEGRPGIGNGRHVGELGDRPAERVDRVGHAEISVGVPAGAPEADLVPVASGAGLADALAASVYREETVDLVGVVLKEILHAVEVAETLLTDVSAEDDAAAGLDSALAERPEQAEHVAEVGGVVAYARAVIAVALLADVKRGVEREDRVEVGADVERRSLGIAALDDRVDVVDLVSDGLVALSLDHLLEAVGLLLLVPGERGDLDELEYLVEGVLSVILYELHALLHFGKGLELFECCFHNFSFFMFKTEDSCIGAGAFLNDSPRIKHCLPASTSL